MFGPEALILKRSKPVTKAPLVSVNVSAFAELKTNRQTTAQSSARTMSRLLFEGKRRKFSRGTTQIYRSVAKWSIQFCLHLCDLYAFLWPTCRHFTERVLNGKNREKNRPQLVTH